MVIPIRITQNADVISPLVRLRLGTDWAYAFVTCWTERNCLPSDAKAKGIDVFKQVFSSKQVTKNIGFRPPLNWGNCRNPISQFCRLISFFIFLVLWSCPFPPTILWISPWTIVRVRWFQNTSSAELSVANHDTSSQRFKQVKKGWGEAVGQYSMSWST